jgi:methylthioribose-1-phosphate isomerase
MLNYDQIRAIEWRDDRLILLDQRVLPEQTVYLQLQDHTAVAQAISDMVVRGAPAIGITAAYGVVLAARTRWRENPHNWKEQLPGDIKVLAAARPTAVNLAWALTRMTRTLVTLDNLVTDPLPKLLSEAQAIHTEDIAANQRMGELGAKQLSENPGAVLTHCNTGSLATGGYGTALGVIRSGVAQGVIEQVYAAETRPWLQGARLTAWELVQDNIPVTLLADGAASYLLRQGSISWVIVGADRIAGNGDVANKIGTYNLAVSARHHGVGFMVVAPTSTIDMTLTSGNHIPIEQRPPEELLTLYGKPMAATGATAWNPVFDITPADLVDGLVTERGVVCHPDTKKMARVMASETSLRFANTGSVL